ncbi:RDD family protein [Herbiconiux sp. UC225_62]|uniref:RDD family protein n=1 Tax=Herbiconiux sp. UC225_62 TaxID=3350168 RepID=UPI0036D3AB7C
MTDSPALPCVQCGSPVPRSAQFCLVCGTPASSRSQSAALGQVAGQAPAAGADGRAVDGWRPTPVAEPIRFDDIVPTGYGRRVVAFLLDGVFGLILWLVVCVPLITLGVIPVVASAGRVAVNGPSAVLLLGMALLFPVVTLVLQAFFGFSLGMLIMGLRIVSVRTLGRPGLGWMLVRNLVIAGASLVFGLGQYVIYLSPLWDDGKRGRGWHDKAARTWVIDVKAGPNPLKAVPGQVEVGDGYPKPPPRIASAPVAPAPAAPAPVPAAAASFAPAPLAEPISTVPGFAPQPPVTPAQLAAEDEFESTRLSDSGRSSATAGSTLFRLDTGAGIPITRHGVVGRDPVSPGGDPADLLIALSGDTLSVSKTHLEFGVDHTGVWVSDRGSTNGSAIVRDDGAEYSLDPGERVVVQAGDRVRLGTRLITVEAG